MTNNIKRITATQFSKKIDSIMDEELITVEQVISIKEYDKSNNLIMDASWGNSDLLSEKYVYEYEDSLLKKRIIYIDEDEIGELEFYEYDSNGKLEYTVVEYLDKSQDKVAHSYNEDGNKLSSITTDEDNDVIQQELWEFDGKNLLSYSLINEYGDQDIHDKMEYDSEGRLESKTALNSIDETEFSYSYEYDQNHKLILESKYRNNGKLIEEKEYEYNTDGRIISEKKENAKETVINRKTYDEHGNEIKTEEYDDENECLNYEVWRAFDNDNNQTNSKVMIHSHDESPNVEYEVAYKYEFYQE